MSSPLQVSVVLATFNRRESLRRLLAQLAEQTLAPDRFEVIVVDDGSVPPARTGLEDLRLPYRLTLLEQPNAGAAAARHRGISDARGELVVIVDDDMELPPGFLAAHAAAHPPGSRRVVLGRMRPSPALGEMPLFERFYARTFEKHAQSAASGRLRGNALYTGNVSLRRADYLAVGGFDRTLGRSEDVELGLRLEAAGAQFAFSEEAFTVHASDHTDYAAWRRRANLYGRYDLRIARKHPALPHADPWRFYFGNSLAKRPFVTLAFLSPPLGRVLADAALSAAFAADRAGLGRAAILGTSLVYDLEYMRGLRAEVGGVCAGLRSALDYLTKGACERPPGPGRTAALAARAVRRLLGSAGA